MKSPLALVIAAKALGASPLTTPCALAAYQMLLREDTARTEAADGRRFTSLLGLVNLQLSHGRADVAASSIEAFRQRWGYGSTVYLLAAPAWPALRRAGPRRRPKGLG